MSSSTDAGGGAGPAEEPTPTVALMAQGRQLVVEKRYKEAIVVYQQVVALDATSHVARHNTAICHLHLGEQDAALESVNRALQKGGDKVAKYYSTKATVLLNKKRRAEAVEAVEAGLKIDPTLASLKEHAALRAPPAAAASPAASGGSASSSSSSGGSAAPRASSSASSSAAGALDFPRSTPAAPEPLALPPSALTTTLAVLRPASLALLLVYFLPLDPAHTAACWRFFLIATELCNILMLVRKHVLPHLPPAITVEPLKEAAQRSAVGAMADLGQPSFVLPIMLLVYSPRPSALALLVAFPTAVLNVYYACEAACGAPVAGPLLAAHVAPRLAGFLVPALAASSCTGEERRKRLVQGLVEAGARYEVYAALILTALALTPLRNLGLLTALATLLYSKYSFNDTSRKVWRELDGSVRAALGTPWLPTAVATPLLRGYAWGSDLAYASATRSLSAAQERQRGGGGGSAAPSCTVQ